MTSPADLPLRAARLLALKRWPYLGPALWRLDMRPGHPKTMGVDAEFHIYYCAEWVAAQTQPALASVLAHEVWHVLRRHFERRGDRHPIGWNVAADAEINDGLPDLPGDCVLPGKFGQPENLLAEQYFEALQNQQQGRPEQGTEGAGASQGGADIDPSDVAAQADKSGQSPGSGSPDQGDSNPGSSAGSGAGDPSPQGAGGEASEGDGAGQSPSSSSQASGRSGPARGHADPHVAGDSSQGLPSPEKYGGSCADGIRREWESAPGGKPMTPAQRRMVERAVAREIRSCGSQPGDSVREWAESMLRERPLPWQQILAGEIRHAVAWASGHGDFTWMRPSRRGAGREYLPPAIRRPIPEVAVIIDASGSMDDVLLASARREVEALLRALGAPAHIVACDTLAHAVGRATSLRGTSLVGGGGTDMGEGIRYAQSLRPRPRVLITLTDGYTPWPKSPPAGARHICVLVGGGSGPKWGKTVSLAFRASHA